MVKKIFQVVFIACFFALPVKAQKITPEEYIALYKDIAIREMKRMGVPAAITLAQGILETESGNSVLVKKSNNHFGIKCKSSWTAGGVSHDDDAVGECFRTYKTAEDSYRDHSNYLRGSERYSVLFDLKPTDYKGWAYGLKKAGYATNPKYPNILIKNIEQYNLQQYTLDGADEVPKFESAKYKDDPAVINKDASLQTDPKQNGYSMSAGKNDQQQKEGGSTHQGSNDINIINGSKCIYALKGTSLLAIASQHNINLHKLLEINELEADGLLEEDQLIFLQKKSKKGDKDFVIAKNGETLYDVAQANGIQLESLLEYNQLNEDGDVKARTKLYLKPIAQSDQAKIIQESASAAKTTIYQVQPKEGLYSVARKHNVTVQQLKEWNNLTSDDLKVGQELIVSK